VAWLLDQQSRDGCHVDVGSLSAYADVSPLLSREVNKVHQLESQARELLEENERFVSCVEIIGCYKLNVTLQRQQPADL